MLKNLAWIYLDNNQISEIKGLESLSNLAWLSLNNNPISSELTDSLGVLSNGRAINPQAFVDYCQKNWL